MSTAAGACQIRVMLVVHPALQLVPLVVHLALELVDHSTLQLVIRPALLVHLVTHPSLQLAQVFSALCKEVFSHMHEQTTKVQKIKHGHVEQVNL